MKITLLFTLSLLISSTVITQEYDEPNLEGSTYRAIVGNISEETIEELECEAEHLLLKLHFKIGNLMEVNEIEEDNCGQVTTVSSTYRFSYSWGKISIGGSFLIIPNKQKVHLWNT